MSDTQLRPTNGRTGRRAAGAAAASLLLIAALVAGACGATGAAAPTQTAAVTAPAVLGDTVSVDQAAALRDAGAFMLDVRQPEEWAAGHIPGATLIPLGDLPGRLAEVPRDQTVVVVCRSGNRSAQGRDILRQAGYTTVTSMAGGMNDWATQGLPVVAGS